MYSVHCICVLYVRFSLHALCRALYMYIVCKCVTHVLMAKVRGLWFNPGWLLVFAFPLKFFSKAFIMCMYCSVWNIHVRVSFPNTNYLHVLYYKWDIHVGSCEDYFPLLRSTVFIYSCPGFKSSIKERMLYSSCKEPLITVVEGHLNITIVKKVRDSAKYE